MGPQPETTLIKMKADLLRAIDDKEVAYLVILYLSAVFDTVDHVILKQSLRERFGVNGWVLAQLESYLTDGYQEVVTADPVIGQVTSVLAILTYEVPHRSVLVGPIVLTLYTTPLGGMQKIQS